MNVTKIPFNQFIGIEKTNTNSEYLLTLKSNEQLKNHLGTVHASALFALAEATSGEFLLNGFSQIEFDIIPVVRKSEVKYCKPANGPVFSKAELININKDEFIAELTQKKRAIIQVKVNLFDSENNKVMMAVFDWFVSVV